jgi:hypothetical protein
MWRNTFWWVWSLLAVAFWLLQRIMAAYSDKTVPENELSLAWGAVRTAVITAMLVSLVVAAVLLLRDLRI